MSTGSAQSRWMSVKNVMTKDVISILDTEDVRDAWEVLMEAGISGAPVVNSTGDIVGVLSVTDIFNAIMGRVEKARMLPDVAAESEDPDAVEREETREFTLAVRAVIESKVLSILPKGQKVLDISPDDSLDRALRLIAEHEVNRLPVVKDGKVVGIVTRQDVIWFLAGRPGTVSQRTDEHDHGDTAKSE